MEQATRDARLRSAPTVSIRSVIERYLRYLRATLETNIDEARRMLSLALNKIVLRTEGEHVVARITGKMRGLLTLGGLDLVASVGAGLVASFGAGRGISSSPNIGGVLEVA